MGKDKIFVILGLDPGIQANLKTVTLNLIQGLLLLLFLTFFCLYEIRRGRSCAYPLKYIVIKCGRPQESPLRVSLWRGNSKDKRI